MPYKHITSKQRVEIGVLLRAGHNLSSIAQILEKHSSTLSRELKRNSKYGKYSVITAKHRTRERRIKANQRFRKIENNIWIQEYIKTKMKKCWSPEQIAGRLKRKYGKTIVCHETIYQYIYNKGPELKKYLRSQKGKYRRRYGTKIREKQREMAKKKRIDQRPVITEKRQRLGDWEGDFIFGKEKKIGMLVHVDRKSGYALADKMDSLLAESVKQTTINKFKNIPKNKRHTFTYDNDSRFTEYELIERNLKTHIYFAYPYHSWERGTGENTNGLLRQFFPKKSSFATITQRDVDGVIRLLNARPRKRLSYLTPNEVFYEKEKCCTLD